MKKDLAEFLFSKVAGYQRDKILKGLDQIFFNKLLSKIASFKNLDCFNDN